MAEAGVHSALSLPLLLPDHVVGAINVYALGREAAARLREISHHEHTKLVEVAERVASHASAGANQPQTFRVLTLTAEPVRLAVCALTSG